MKTIYLIALSVLVCTGLQTACRADMSAPGTVIAITGSLQSLDTTSNSIVVKDPTGYTRTMQVAENTKILRAGQTVSLADLKLGDTISVATDTSVDPRNPNPQTTPLSR